MMRIMFIVSPPEHPLKRTIFVQTGVFATLTAVRGAEAEEVSEAAWQRSIPEGMTFEDQATLFNWCIWVGSVEKAFHVFLRIGTGPGGAQT